MDYKKMVADKNGNYDPNRDVLATQSIGGDEYYTLPIHAKQIVECLNIPTGSTIWCPFDKAESEFVKALEENYEVVYGHIETGQDFFKTEPPFGCAGIVSNPPFSLKKDILKRIRELQIPFALLLPALWLNDGIPFDYGYQMIFWRKRVYFNTPDGAKNKPRTTCFALSDGMFKKDLTIFHN